MQTAYGQRTIRRRGGAGRGGKKTEDRTERVRTVQLVVCLILFLAVFIGKGVFPEKIAQTGRQLLALIRANTDFRQAFSDLGEALSEQESVLGELGEFCVEVLGPARQEETVQTLPPLPEYTAGSGRLASEDQNQMTAFYLGLEDLPEEWRVEVPGREQDEAPAALVEEERALEVGAVVEASNYQGEVLPEHYTMDWLYLGDMETVTPVLGNVTSSFGYRDHPTMGSYAVHGGVDIGANKGASVAAFADGVVEYIGKSDDFGLYLQIIHENGVKTFYAHCSKLCVSKGQQVSAGEKVAEVGSTGQSTGPHLHFEIKWGGMRLNPLYYIDTRETT